MLDTYSKIHPSELFRSFEEVLENDLRDPFPSSTQLALDINDAVNEELEGGGSRGSGSSEMVSGGSSEMVRGSGSSEMASGSSEMVRLENQVEQFESLVEILVGIARRSLGLIWVLFVCLFIVHWDGIHQFVSLEPIGSQ